MSSAGPLGDKEWYEREAAATWEMGFRRWDVEAGFRRAGFVVTAEAPVGDRRLLLRIRSEDWELLRLTLLKGAGVLADEKAAGNVEGWPV